ncbi:MAG: adenylate/guanylate cyclase domain-containing protein [Spirochaetales bacterium]|nr:adenylate/guanylate cyclase domain-containing protein [Spirochaetales bacterium]
MFSQNDRPFLTGGLLCLALFATLQCSKSAGPLATAGLLDLRNWSFEDQGSTRLEGEWEFYWQQLRYPGDFVNEKPDFIKVKGDWNKHEVNGKPVGADGHATYRLKFLLQNPPDIMALKLPGQFMSFRAFVNGREIYKSGEVGSQPAQTEARYRPGTAAFVPATENEIVVHVANFTHRVGGLRNAITLGTEQQIARAHTINLAFELFVVGSLVIMGLYHLGLFSLRQNDSSTLHLGIFCLIIALRNLMLGEIFLTTLWPLSYNIQSRIEYLTFYLAMPSVFLFLRSLYPAEFWKWAIYTILGLSLPFSLIVLLAPIKIFTSTLLYFYIVTLLSGLIGLIVLVRAIRNGRDGARLIIAGSLILMATTVNDIFYGEGKLDTMILVPFGLFLFILFQSYLLSARSAAAFIAVENLSAYLQNLNRALERFVPQEFLKFLNRASIVEVNLGDQVQQEMTVLFSDIRSFTALSETMTPKENFDFLNAYLRRMSPIIATHKGFIDKYIGDAIMALFPISAEDALQAAIDMQAQIIHYNAKRVAVGYRPIQIGIGLHTGTLMLGTIGGEDRMDGTVIADAVNLASRMEGLTKIYGAHILITGATLERIPDHSKYHTRLLDKVKVKGKSEPVSVIEVLDGAPQEEVSLKIETRQDFEKALQWYLKPDFHQARLAFEKVLAINPNDVAARLFASRCAYFEEHGVPPDWAGVVAMESK